MQTWYFQDIHGVRYCEGVYLERLVWKYALWRLKGQEEQGWQGTWCADTDAVGVKAVNVRNWILK